MVECAKLAYADREAFYGDPAFTDVPLATLLSPAYNDERRAPGGRRGLHGAAARRGAGRTPWVDHEAAVPRRRC